MSQYFLCGIGGSGMLPLALILKGQGHEIFGSDRSYDQGRTPQKFSWLSQQGIKIFPQDGSGITSHIDAVIISTAVEDTIPDIKEAKKNNIPVIHRAELLAQFFNRAKTRIAIAGTSGKSTTTGMIGFVLHQSGLNPTVMNGAVFRNFYSSETPYSTALSGTSELFVTEADESDGSISLYNPTISVLNNVSLDHKSMSELKELFSTFISKGHACILNLDNEVVAELAPHAKNAITYSLKADSKAHLVAKDIRSTDMGIQATIADNITGSESLLTLQIPGKHNISNALSCIGACLLCNLKLADICFHLASYTGVKRRLEVIGKKNCITVIDDFAHNPDKIAATLATLKEFPGRLIIAFQVHGYAPINLLHTEFSKTFADYFSSEDLLYVPEVLYLGGTVNRTITAKDMIKEMQEMGIKAEWFESRAQIADKIIETARPGDRIVVMGARDDTLSEFATDILKRL